MCSGSLVSSAAHRIGSAAFFAPETSTSPSSGTPPSMISLSKRVPSRGPLFRRERLHRERVYLLAHAIAQRAVDELVLPHLGETAKARADDDRLEMVAVAGDFDVIALEALLDALLDEIGIHDPPKDEACSRSGAARG